MSEREFTYHDGIIEGRLIEHGFYGIGKSMFVCRTVNTLYVVTYPENGDSTFEVFQSISEQPEKEMELTSFIDWVRHDDFTANMLKIYGHIDDVIDVVKLAKSSYK